MKKVLSGHWANIPNPQHWAQLCFFLFSQKSHAMHNRYMISLNELWFWSFCCWKCFELMAKSEETFKVTMTMTMTITMMMKRNFQGCGWLCWNIRLCYFFWCTTTRMTVDLWVAGPQERPSLYPVLQAWASKPLNHTLGTFWNSLYRLSLSCHHHHHHHVIVLSSSCHDILYHHYIITDIEYLR